MRLKTLIACFVLIFSLLSAAGAQALTIKNIRGGAHPDKMRLVLEMDRVADFRVTLASEPRRMVVDLPDATIDDRAVVQLRSVGITELREEGTGDRHRLIFMLTRPVKIISAFMLPNDGVKPDRLVIDFRDTDNADFARQTTQSLGTLPAESARGDGILGVLMRPGKPVSQPRQQDSERTAPVQAAAVPRLEEGGAKTPLPQAKPGTRIYTVVIDAGHGGKDPGAIGVGGIQEKNITLAAARELARQLERTGRYKPVLTRSTDKFILLPERVRIARRAKADLFISLHADKAGGADTDGLSIYTLSDTASDAQTEKLAAQENKVDLLAGIDLSHEEKDVANILIDLAMRENMNQSRFFANKVVTSMDGNDIDLLPRPHRYAGFAVLKAADIPSVLVEMGFLSNPAETRRLQDEAHRRRLLQGLVEGIDNYFAYLEKNARL